MRVAEAARWAGILVLVGAMTAGCGGGERQTGSGCPQGSALRITTNEVTRPGAETRDAAVRAALERLGLTATEDAITHGIIVGSPGSSPGTEEVQVRTTDGSAITMTLAPLEPGWAVASTSWCAPDAA